MTTSDLDGPVSEIDELVKLVGDGHRLAILQVIWEAFDIEAYMVGVPTTITTDTLLEQTFVPDRDTLDGHLKLLEEELLVEKDGAYQLTPQGYQFMRSLESTASTVRVTFEEAELEDACPFCGGIIVGEYDREILHVRCLNCGGLADPGTINYVQIPANSAANLDFANILDAATMELTYRVRFSRTGLCPECFKQIDRTVRVCNEHERDAEGLCSACETRFAAEVIVDCPGCGWGGVGPLAEYALIESSAVHQYERDHGTTVFHQGPWQFRIDALGRVTERIHGTNPTRCIYEFDYDEPVIVEFTVLADGTLAYA